MKPITNNKRFYAWYKELEPFERKAFFRLWKSYTGKSRSSFYRYMHGYTPLSKENALLINVLADCYELKKKKAEVLQNVLDLEYFKRK